MGMVQREIKILEKSTNKKPNLEYRLLELYTERIKLTHEKNNQTFLASTTSGGNAAKESFFTETKKEFQVITQYGLSLLKNDPNHPYFSHITFNLGLNSRDYGNGALTEKMLLDSISFAVSQKNSTRKLLAEAALADFYYNEKKYTEAIRYYLLITQNKDDQWIAKYKYNLGWCYLKERQFDNAISSMSEALSYQNNPKYVKISDQMLSTLSSFYTYAGKPLEAMTLYKLSTEDPIPFLLNLAAKTSEKGHGKETEVILKDVHNLIIKTKAYKYQEELLHAYLDYFKQYGKIRAHWQISQKLKNYYSNVINDNAHKYDLKKEAIEKLKNTAGFVQLKLTKDIRENNLSFDTKDLKQVLDYYDYLVILDPEKKAHYLYFKGETNYSVQKLEDASQLYYASIDHAVRTKDLKTAEKAVNSLLDLTSHEKLAKETNKKYLTYAYTQHVRLWPKHERSKIIYPKLFEIFHEEKNDKKSSGVILAYNKSFPEDNELQQRLMTRVLDQFIEKKDAVKLLAWINRLRQGLLAFKADDLVKMDATLAAIYFFEYQEMAKKGDKVGAAAGFEKVFLQQKSPAIKGQAAQFAALAYLEAGETQKTYQWQMTALENTSEEKILLQRAELLKVTERLYKLQDFSASSKMSQHLLKKFCSIKDDIQGRLFEVSIMTSLVEGHTQQAEEIIVNFSSCLKNLESREIGLLEIFREHEKNKDLNKLKHLVSSHNLNTLKNHYKHTLNAWYWNSRDEKLKRRILNEYASMNDPEATKWLNEHALFDEAAKKVAELNIVVIWKAVTFDGEAFNESLEKHLQEHQRFKLQFQSLLQSSQTDLVLNSTVLFSKLYLNMAKKINSLSPQGLDEKTLAEFKGAMSGVAGEFKKASSQYDEELKKVLKSREILSQGARSLASIDDIEAPHTLQENLVLVDQWGKK